MHTLIVDDLLTNRLALQRMLDRFGSCVMAGDGREAIAALAEAWDERRPFDLVCLDIMMPAMNGEEALVKIRELETGRGIRNQERVKIFMVTDVQDPSAVNASYCDGCTAYLTKPVEYRLLIGNLVHLGLISRADVLNHPTAEPNKSQVRPRR